MSPRSHTIRTTLALTMALGAVAQAAHARLAVGSSPSGLATSNTTRSGERCSTACG
jgi:hypothetical protein